VRDAAGERADGLHLLRAAQLASRRVRAASASALADVARQGTKNRRPSCEPADPDLDGEQVPSLRRWRLSKETTSSP
jgi:hypothetical protein